MPNVTYTNRRGRKYLLCKIFTKKGKPRYVFSLRPVGTPIAEMPPDHEIVESVNGVVSLRRAGQTQIASAEVDVVRAEIARHRHLVRYQVEPRKDALTVFEPIGIDVGELASMFGASPTIFDFTNRHPRFDPVMRFILVDDQTRTFEVERMCYRGSMYGKWLPLHVQGPLAKLAGKYVRCIGTDDFFELY
ncbi:MAG: hypothetical protein HY897_09685 [Deltaproteobacteria bacterium]|nr:hypothetical protein [Deltaproteobacteria bacterium]